MTSARSSDTKCSNPFCTDGQTEQGSCLRCGGTGRETIPRPSKYVALCSRLRQRLITIPKPGAKPFKQTYPVSYTHTAGTVHKAGDSAGYVSFNPTMGACAAGYDPNNVMAIEHIFVVDPLCEEVARALESKADETNVCLHEAGELCVCRKCGETVNFGVMSTALKALPPQCSCDPNPSIGGSPPCPVHDGESEDAS